MPKGRKPVRGSTAARPLPPVLQLASWLSGVEPSAVVVARFKVAHLDACAKRRFSALRTNAEQRLFDLPLVWSTGIGPAAADVDVLAVALLAGTRFAVTRLSKHTIETAAAAAVVASAGPDVAEAVDSLRAVPRSVSPAHVAEVLEWVLNVPAASDAFIFCGAGSTSGGEVVVLSSALAPDEARLSAPQRRVCDEPLGEFIAACFFCGASVASANVTLYACGACPPGTRPAYCSPHCQAADWPQHEPECGPKPRVPVLRKSSRAAVAAAMAPFGGAYAAGEHEFMVVPFPEAEFDAAVSEQARFILTQRRATGGEQLPVPMSWRVRWLPAVLAEAQQEEGDEDAYDEGGGDDDDDDDMPGLSS